VQVPAATPAAVTADSCRREALQQRADAYLQAMAAGEPKSLKLHPSVRYTENGAEQFLGLGVWLNRPTPEFARHALDEQQCSSVTEAVLSQGLAEIVFGVRLRYLDDQLLEVEAQVVSIHLTAFDPKSIIPEGPDPWVQPVEPSQRMQRQDLARVAANFFDSVADSSLRPPTAADCKLRQNGSSTGTLGSECALKKEDGRFEQVRYPVIDVTTGIVTTIGARSGLIGMFMFKVLAGTIQNIEVIGGSFGQDTGW